MRRKAFIVTITTRALPVKVLADTIHLFLLNGINHIETFIVELYAYTLPCRKFNPPGYTYFPLVSFFQLAPKISP